MADPTQQNQNAPDTTPDAPYGAVKDAPEQSDAEKSTSEVQALRQEMEANNKKWGDKFDTQTAENNQLKGTIDTLKNGSPKDDSTNEEAQNISTQYVQVENQIKALDKEIYKSIKAEDDDPERVANLQARKRDLEAKGNDLQSQYKDLLKNDKANKQTQKQEKNTQSFFNGMQKAVQEFPELSDGRGGINVNSNLYLMTQIILNEGAQKAKFTSGMRQYINPDYDHASGFLAASAVAKARMGKGKPSGKINKGPNNEPLTGGFGSDAQDGGDDQEFGGQTQKKLTQLRAKYLKTNSEKDRTSWINASFRYKNAKETAK